MVGLNSETWATKPNGPSRSLDSGSATDSVAGQSCENGQAEIKVDLNVGLVEIRRRRK